VEKNTTKYEHVGSVSYPGIVQIVGASYTRSHGIAPGVCIIEMAPQPLDPKNKNYVQIEQNGYLKFQFDTVETKTDAGGFATTRESTIQILMQGCRPDKAALRRAENNEIWQIPIFDRRWKWKFGSFSGHWNIKKNGIIEKRKEKTVRQLADMCLEAMGELNYDTKDLDELEKLKKFKYRKAVRPEVHWDRIAPAQALDDLVNSIGYRVCLGWDDRVRIRRAGVTKQNFGNNNILPTDDLMSGGFESDLPEVPESITVVGNHTMHETAWELEAVGLDTDGMWKPINHLSYKPNDDNGWHISSPPTFPRIEQELKEVEDNKKPKEPEFLRRKKSLQLARETVFRCYRLKYPVGTKEDETLRKKYDKLGDLIAHGVRNGDQYGVFNFFNANFDYEVEEYEEAGRELFRKSRPVLPGPKQKNPKTGKLEDYVLEEFNQVLPCFETRAELSINPYTGKLERKPASMVGSIWDEDKRSNTQLNVPIQRDKYEILPDLGIIKFKEPIIRLGTIQVTDENGKKSPSLKRPFPARLLLLIATPLKSIVGETARYEYEYKIPEKYKSKPASLPKGLKDKPQKVPKDPGTKVVINNQIVLAYRAVYKFFHNSKKNNAIDIKQHEVDTNFKKEELEKQALATVAVESLNIVTQDGGSGVYAGLKKIEIDGAIHQVTISRNESGMTTTISRNREIAPIVPDFDERQREASLKEMIQSQSQIIDKTQKVKPKG